MVWVQACLGYQFCRLASKGSRHATVLYLRHGANSSRQSRGHSNSVLEGQNLDGALSLVDLLMGP